MGKEITNNKVPAWKYIIAVLALWFFTLFGGAVVVWLINAFSPAMTRYRPGDLGYFVLKIVTGAVGVWVGNEIMVALFVNKANIFCMVNNIVLASALGCIALFMFFLGSLNIVNALQWIVGIGTAIYYAADWNKTERIKVSKSQP